MTGSTTSTLFSRTESLASLPEAVRFIMGCQHSTPAPTEADYLVDHPRSGALLCKSMEPVPVGITFDFELPTQCWNKDTEIGLQKAIKFSPEDMSPETGDQQVLMLRDSSTGKPLAVLIMKDPKKHCVQICAFHPSHEEQNRCGVHEGRPVYPWALVENIRNSQQFSMKTTVDDAYYQTDLYGPVSAHKPVKFVIKRNGIYCASVEEEKKLKIWKCKLCPGIDPALILCFVACYDKFRQTNEEMLKAAHHTTTYNCSNVL